MCVGNNKATSSTTGTQPPATETGRGAGGAGAPPPTVGSGDIARAAGSEQQAMQPADNTQRLVAIEAAAANMFPEASSADLYKVIEKAAGPDMQNLAPGKAVWKAGVAHIRHNHTDYDDRLLKGIGQDSARVEVSSQVNDMLSTWGSTRRVTTSRGIEIEEGRPVVQEQVGPSGGERPIRMLNPRVEVIAPDEVVVGQISETRDELATLIDQDNYHDADRSEIASRIMQLKDGLQTLAGMIEFCRKESSLTDEFDQGQVVLTQLSSTVRQTIGQAEQVLQTGRRTYS